MDRGATLDASPTREDSLCIAARVERGSAGAAARAALSLVRQAVSPGPADPPAGRRVA